MAELISIIGDKPERYRYGDVRAERLGFLSIYSYELTDRGYRQDLMSRGDAVVVMPADMHRRELYMVEQPRYLRAFTETGAGEAALDAARTGSSAQTFDVPADRIRVMEMPAGVIDGGESPVDAAARELEEETGIRVPASAFETIASYYPSIGGSTERITAFLAHLDRDDIEFVVARGDGHEQILVWKLGFDEAFELMTDGKIITASCALLLRELRIRDLAR